MRRARPKRQATPRHQGWPTDVRTDLQTDSRSGCRWARGKRSRTAPRWDRPRAKGRLRRLAQANDLLRSDLEVVVRLADDGRAEAVLLEHGPHLLRRHVPVVEADHPSGAARVVDRKLQAEVGERRQQDQDQAGDRENEREEVQPAALADDVIHVRAPRAGRSAGWLPSPRTHPRAGRTGLPSGPTADGRRRA